MQVKEILRKKPADVITITADQSLHRASQLLAEHNIGALVVVDDDGIPAGILSERDIVRALAESKGAVADQIVSEAMTEDIIITLPDDDLTYVSNTMTNKRIRHLPVMDGNTLAGIISIGDVVKVQLEHFEGEAHTLRQYITGGYS